MKSKRLLTGLTLLLSLTLMLSACSPTASQAPASADKSASPTAAATATEAAPTTPAVRTLKLMGSVDTELWDTRDKQPAWQAVEKLLAAKGLALEFEAVSSEQYTQVLQTRTATASDLPDLINISSMDSTTAVSLGKAGVFLDVKPIVEKYSNGNIKTIADKYFPNFWGPCLDESGKAYWFPGWNVMTYGGTKPFYSTMVPIVRYDWLQKLKLSVPTTIDELAADLKAFRTSDANGNSKADEVMLFTPSFEYLAPFFGLPSSNIEVDISDNKVKSPWLMKDKLVAYLTFLQDMTTSGVLDVDALDKPAEYSTQKIAANQVSCQMGFALTGAYDAAVSEFSGQYLGVVTPKDPNDYYVYGAPAYSCSTKTAITKACKDLQAAADFFDICYTEDYAAIYRFGVKGVTYNVENGYITPILNLGNRDMELAYKGIPAVFASGVVPCVRIEQWEAQTGTLGDLLDLRKPIGDTYGCGGAKVMVWGNGTYEIALPSDADAQKLADISTDLNTYMSETLTKLAIGQYKLADLDTYIAKMKSLGLEDAIAIKQRQHDSYIGK
jgi:putative aldouronate transport system substrate-binding protein